MKSADFEKFPCHITSNYIAHNLQNFQVLFFENNFREFATDSLWRNNQATYFYWIKAGVVLEWSSFISEHVAVGFAIYFGFTCLVRVAQYDFLKQSDAVFSKELAIANTA